MRVPAPRPRPAVASSGPILGLVFLLFVNVLFAFIRPALPITTATFFITALLSLSMLIGGRWRIPPLLDIAFVFASIFYFGMPGIFYLVYPNHAPVPSMPLQQALVGSAIATFHLARYLTRWRTWSAVVARLDSTDVTVINWKFAAALLVVCVLWIGAAIPGLSSYMAMAYGTREVEQRSDMTIPLLGFDLLAIVAMAMLTERLIRTDNRRMWWLMGFVGFAAYGILCVFIFGARTKLVWCLLLPAVSALSVRRLTRRMVIIAMLSVFALLPVLDLIGRARLTFHINEPSVKELAAVDIGQNLEALAASSEMVAMAPIADHVIGSLGQQQVSGTFVGWSIIQAPPAFFLRPFGLSEPRSLAGRYTKTYYPDVWARGGAFGLSLSAESYCNFAELGGIFSGVVLCLFVVFFERVILSRLPFALALAVTADFMIEIARVNRGGLESLAKPVAVAAVMLGVIKMCEMFTARRRVIRFFARPGDA